VSICQYCYSRFEGKSGQVYCNKDCSIQATKIKRKERQKLESIKQRMKTPRFCANGCGTKLSAYNDKRICTSCKVDKNKVSRAIESLKDLFEFEERL